MCVLSAARVEAERVSTGVIAGGAAGAVVLIVLIVIIAFVVMRYSCTRIYNIVSLNTHTHTHTHTYTLPNHISTETWYIYKPLSPPPPLHGVHGQPHSSIKHIPPLALTHALYILQYILRPLVDLSLLNTLCQLYEIVIK